MFQNAGAKQGPIASLPQSLEGEKESRRAVLCFTSISGYTKNEVVPVVWLSVAVVGSSLLMMPHGWSFCACLLVLRLRAAECGRTKLLIKKDVSTEYNGEKE